MSTLSVPTLSVLTPVDQLMNWTDKAFKKHNVQEINKFFEDENKKDVCDLISPLTGKTELDNWDMQERHVVRTTAAQKAFMAEKLAQSTELVEHANTFLNLVESMDKYYAALIYYGYL